MNNPNNVADDINPNNMQPISMRLARPTSRFYGGWHKLTSQTS